MLHKILSRIAAILILSITISCGIYSFTGGDTGDAKTIQIDFFNNNAQLIEPTLSQEFTINLQDFFITQTNLNLVKTGGDLQFEGEITRYTITPMSANADQGASQNRLTIEFNVRFYNKADETKNFEKRFSHFYDYDADVILQGTGLDTAFEEIFERVNQNIFNASVANW
ncbi:LptE family protein [Wenyingzhuangia sp. 2_MG-2023]|uniref:LptE family protein n=1 Tax=Wenyingzhuangia sp. 2_MG-2023 TaxID=3062639 RepID=UPI0026E157C1|nr:LptE family protein [Wenyingzhuangia sp. 2_MG-2023]MDO6737673.1 LptE family protein [Wenyingzhuangia sp. 2_MG-2023]MDO6802512.1 LptE family protein [Wenyingzhuangia sp. 1_MG-2023]